MLKRLIERQVLQASEVAMLDVCGRGRVVTIEEGDDEDGEQTVTECPFYPCE